MSQSNPQDREVSQLSNLSLQERGEYAIKLLPEQVIEQLKEVEQRYPGLERIGVSHPVGTPQKVVLEQLEWFSEAVMPAFKGRVEAAVPAD